MFMQKIEFFIVLYVVDENGGTSHVFLQQL